MPFSSLFFGFSWFSYVFHLDTKSFPYAPLHFRPATWHLPRRLSGASPSSCRCGSPASASPRILTPAMGQKQSQKHPKPWENKGFGYLTSWNIQKHPRSKRHPHLFSQAAGRGLLSATLSDMRESVTAVEIFQSIPKALVSILAHSQREVFHLFSSYKFHLSTSFSSSSVALQRAFLWRLHRLVA